MNSIRTTIARHSTGKGDGTIAGDGNDATEALAQAISRTVAGAKKWMRRARERITWGLRCELEWDPQWGRKTSMFFEGPTIREKTS